MLNVPPPAAEFGCAGQDGYFDSIKIWNAEPAGK
jgi:hypothetical protein